MVRLETGPRDALSNLGERYVRHDDETTVSAYVRCENTSETARHNQGQKPAVRRFISGTYAHCDRYPAAITDEDGHAKRQRDEEAPPRGVGERKRPCGQEHADVNGKRDPERWWCRRSPFEA